MLSTMTGIALAEEWELIYCKDGISGYQRHIPGTDMKEFKADGFVEARMEVIGEVIRDIPSYPQWMAKCKEAVVLKDIDRNTKIFYNEVSVPWPVPNRGVIITNTTKYDLATGRAIIKFKAITSPEYHIKPGRVQITYLEGEYLLEYFGRSMTKVTYRHKASPGGNISTTVANFQSKLFPVINIKGLRKMVELQKYKDRGNKCEEYALIENMVKDPSAVKTISRNRISEYFNNKDDLNRIFEDNRVVSKIIENKASFGSIRHLVVDACKILLNDDAVRTRNRNKSLREIVNIDKFYNDRGLTSLFVQDNQFIDLVMNNKDLLRKLLSDRILLAKIIDSKRLAKSISNDPLVINKMVNDEDLLDRIKTNTHLFQSPDGLKKILEERIERYKTTV